MTEAETERKRIVDFLWAVYENSTHGASSLMERAIQAVASNDMDNARAVADADNPNLPILNTLPNT